MSSKENKDEPKDQGKKIQRTRGRSSMTVQEREELKQVLLDIEVQTQQTQKVCLLNFVALSSIVMSFRSFVFSTTDSTARVCQYTQALHDRGGSRGHHAPCSRVRVSVSLARIVSYNSGNRCGFLFHLLVTITPQGSQRPMLSRTTDNRPRLRSSSRSNRRQTKRPRSIRVR
jgi:hypothetical protein